MMAWSSPRPWGCFRSRQVHQAGRPVVPTPVGVFLRGAFRSTMLEGRPHARGGVSLGPPNSCPVGASSPRPWGCFFLDVLQDDHPWVVPTPVGVFLSGKRVKLRLTSRPHARGGVSVTESPEQVAARSSPRPWGCFSLVLRPGNSWRVVPTPVGVFLPACRETRTCWCRPHARGGVSRSRSCTSVASGSSPRPWGCFLVTRQRIGAVGVVPTPVGVFPSHCIGAGCWQSRPHARGGVSGQAQLFEAWYRSSPRPWGCFHINPPTEAGFSVVPTPVGVFLSWRCIPGAG